MKIRFISLSALCCAALVFLSGCGKKDDGKIRIGGGFDPSVGVSLRYAF